jgi:septum formation protein
MTISAVQTPEPPLILASASAARRAVLAAAGLAFTTEAAAVDEAAIKDSARDSGMTAPDAALILAHAKARRVSARHPEALVIGADQILVCRDGMDERWFDKPADLAAARTQLQTLSGRRHELVTAVVCWRAGESVWQQVAVPRLTMRTLSPEFLAVYLKLEGELLLSSVGGYRLEGVGVQLFSAVEGEHSAILGLPLLPLLHFLRGHGVLLA